jgi:alkyl hydroperoxide reductase subunit AhpF
MRFSIQDASNADGQRFALSPLGKKYFVTAVLKLTGIMSRRLDDLAAQVPQEVESGLLRVRPLVDQFKNGRG